MNNTKIVRWITITVLITVIIAVSFGSYLQSKLYHHNFWDDTYISLTYVQNFAEGEGLVFNEGEKVEGYTNFLWIMMLTPVYHFSKMFSIDFITLVKIFCTFFTMLNLLLIYLICCEVFRKNILLAIIPLLLYATDTTTSFYGMIGMENPFQITWLLLAIFLYLKEYRYSSYFIGISFAFAIMTRPDSAIFVFIFYLVILYRLIRKKWSYSPDYYIFQKRFFISLFVVLGIFGLYFIWRYSYYGMLLPNTFYAKVTGDFKALQTGLDYVLYFIYSREYLPIIAIISVVFIKKDWVKIMLFFILLHTAYVIYIGGDFYPGARFLVVMLPFIYILNTLIIYELIKLVAKLIKNIKIEIVTSLIIAVLLFFIVKVHLSNSLELGPVAREIKPFSEKCNDDVRYAKYLDSISKKGESIYVAAIGSFGYFTDLHVIDILGLINKDVSLEKIKIRKSLKAGHRKEASIEYGLSKNPTYNPAFNYNHDYRKNGYYLHPSLTNMLTHPYVWVKDYLKKEDLIQSSLITFEQMDGWKKTGIAFANNPKTGTEKNQGNVFGQEGKFINSYSSDKGDLSVGILTSPPVKLEGDVMILDVGGGNYVDKTYVALYVDEMEVARASGTNTEYLTRRSWNIRRYKGKEGIIKIVDNANDSWGHILVDNIRQYHDYTCKYTCIWNERTKSRSQ